MILGLMAGELLRSDRPRAKKVLWMVAAACAFLAVGLFINEIGLCPSVKRIWTPSWVLVSGGWCWLLLAGFYVIVDWAGFKRWALPLTVIGMNSIVAYCMASLVEGFVARSLTTHLGSAPFEILGKAYEPLLHGGAVLLIFWLVLYWMYRKRIFVRV
jgi:predicted acyltransferase